VTGKVVGKRGVSIEEVAKKLVTRDMDPHYSFYLGEECLDPAKQSELALKGKVLATAQMGRAEVRRRTAYAMNVAYALYGGICDWRGITRRSIEDRCKMMIYAQGGTACTLERLVQYYPAKVKAPVRRVTKEEAMEAIHRCGLLMPAGTKPFSFSGEEGLEPVSINPEADNGFPYGSKWNNELTHGPILSKAQDIRVALDRAYQSGGRSAVVKWLRDMESSPETLKYVALKGKCKADPYKVGKVVDNMMRFYNAFPRQVILNLMRVTQPMDRAARHINKDDIRYKSAIGVTLVRGGADDLVAALDRSLAEDGVAYTHTGDDTLVAVEYGEGVLMFSVDCSSFDLTQRAEVTEEVHNAIYEQLRKIDGPAASLWYAYARERVVVTVNAQTYRWKHGGPSGFPLQSKVNDCLMDVYIQRLLARLVVDLEQGRTEMPSRETLDAHLKAIGREMGLVARLEDYLAVPHVSSVREALKVHTFLYIGYHFYVEEEDGEDRVYVIADIARQLGQLQYPNSFWVEKEKLLGMEAVRLAGILISLGRPPACWRAAFDAAREKVGKYLGIAMRKVGPDNPLDFLPENAFVGVSGDDVKSLQGLLNALNRDPDVLWGHEKEILKESTLTIFVPATVAVSAALGRGSALEPIKPPTHPATMKNLGRPPPTVRWGPPKQRRYKTTTMRIAGLKRQANVKAWHDTLVDWEEVDDFWWNEVYEMGDEFEGGGYDGDGDHDWEY